MSETQSYKTVTFTQAQAIQAESALSVRVATLEGRMRFIRLSSADLGIHQRELSEAKAARDLLRQAPLSRSEGLKS